MALIDAAYDKKVEVRQDIARALYELGKKQPELVLSSCNSYLNKHQKLIQGHRIVLLDMMKRIIKDSDDALDIDLSKELIQLASSELTKSKEIEPEWQTAASNVLVALGTKFGDEVMAELLQKLVPGSLPHYFVVLTLANLATENANGTGKYLVVLTLASLVTENVFGVVPFMKDIFSRMLLMLGMAKQDNLRWVFAHCIGCFSEAILDYCANIENAPYPDISKDRFYGEIFSAYEILFNVWLQSKEPRVRLAIVSALGHMSHLMARDKLEEQIQRLLHGIIQLYRKQSEHYLITQSLCMILDSATADGSLMLLPLLDQLLNGLHQHACTEPDYSNIQTVKNFNELLRCFQVFTKGYPDRVVAFLQQKLESGNERSKVATLGIFRHLINSSDVHLQNKKEVILSGLSITLHDGSLKVRKALAQTITAMAHHGYLNLEGGKKMVEFIVRQCSITDEDKTQRKPGDQDSVSPAGLKSMCENILHLITTTVQRMEDVLWPYLMECLIPAHYTEAMTAVCRSLSYLAAKKREEGSEEYKIEYSIQVNVPKPAAQIARLLVLAGHPLKGGGNRGLNALKFMHAMAPSYQEDIIEMWDTVIPKLIQYLEENGSDSENWNQKAWEDLMLKLLAKSLSEVDSEEWNLTLGREMGQQITLYTDYPEEKNFIYKCLGVALRKIGTTDFIREHLNLIFSTVNHASQKEREGCAMGAGFCAASHFDQCLMKLEEITKTDMIRKSTGFMGLMKDKTEADVERIKSTVMLCYGYVVFYGPPQLMTSRLETNVLRVVNPHLATVRDGSVKQNLIRSIDLIGKALQPSHVTTNFVLTKRGDLLKHMQNYLLSEPKGTISETRSLAIDAITNLVKLNPKLNEQELQEIVKICSESVYPIPPNAPSVGETDKSVEKLLSLAIDSFNSMMKEISAKEASPAGLHSIIKQLESYLLSMSDHERERCIQTIKVILTHFLQSINSNGDSHFSPLGTLLGRMLPRCTDPVMPVRQDSMECIQILLTINDRYEGVPANVSDERIEGLSKLKETLEGSDASVLFSVVNELAAVISRKTPDEQLKNLVYSLIEGLSDLHSQSSSGACAMLNCIMKYRGTELGTEVNKLVVEIHNKLLSVSFQQTITGSLIALRTLASHHLILVLTAFLGFPIPFTTVTKDFWQTLAKDKDLTQDTFDHLLDLLSRSPPFNEREDPRDKKAPIRIATMLPVAVCCALTEVFRVPETEELVSNHFAKLFSAILLRMGSCVRVRPPLASPEHKAKRKDGPLQPMSLATECCKEVLTRGNCQAFRKYVDDKNGWTQLEDEKTFTDGLEVIAVGLCDCAPKHVHDVVSCLLPALTSSYDNQRVVPTAIFAELINQRCRGDMQLVELLMNSLLSKLVDPSHMVRRLCIRGLGNVANVGGQKLQTYSTTILSAMMAGMDDKEDPENSITLEAMSGLSRILSQLDETNVRQILINICLRIRPCFEKDKVEVRAAAISLFGNLARFGTGPSETPFLEQIHTNFVSILLHLNEEPEVTKACKVALRQLGPRLGSTAINDMFQKHLIEGGQLHYGEFMNDLSRLIIADYPDKVNFYVMGCVGFFKSSWTDIRANAAIFVGFLLGNLQDDMTISKEHVSNALIMLLKDQASKVRSSAAEAMSLLYDF